MLRGTIVKSTIAGVRDTYAAVHASIAASFTVEPPPPGAEALLERSLAARQAGSAAGSAIALGGITMDAPPQPQPHPELHARREVRAGEAGSLHRDARWPA